MRIHLFGCYHFGVSEKFWSAVKNDDCLVRQQDLQSSKILSLTDPIHSLANSYMTGDEDHDESDEMHWSWRNNMMVTQTSSSHKTCDKDDHDDGA